MKMFKYVLQYTEINDVPMPSGAEVLSVGIQSGVLVAWALVEEKMHLATRRLVVHGTGHPLKNDSMLFVGTVQGLNGLVWHIFDDGEK